MNGIRYTVATAAAALGMIVGLAPAAHAEQGIPTISDPQGMTPVIQMDVYRLICSDFRVNGVSLNTIKKILIILQNDEEYQYSLSDAASVMDSSLSLACPQYVPVVGDVLRNA